MISELKPQRKRWSVDSVLLEVKALPDCSPRAVQSIRPDLYGAAIRLFGSWKVAVAAAGIDYSTVIGRAAAGSWDQARVVAEVRRLPSRNSNYVRRHYRGLYSAALRVFSDWATAVESAGFDYSTVRQGWAAEDAYGLRYRRLR